MIPVRLGGPKCFRGKWSYATRKDAKATRKRMVSTGHSGALDLDVFKCPVCGLFHLGHPGGRTRIENRDRILAKELELETEAA